MKAIIYKYRYNRKFYYAEGYDEETIRTCLERKLNLEEGSIEPGIKPDYYRELKRIWNKSDTRYKLTLRKEETTNQEELQSFKSKQHCLYELDLFLKHDMTFLSGINDTVKNNPSNRIEMYYKHGPEESEIGYDMAYSFKGIAHHQNCDTVYRFPKWPNAYSHIRSSLIKLGIADESYKNTDLTNMDMCDSTTAGFGNPDYKGATPTQLTNDKTYPIELNYYAK